MSRYQAGQRHYRVVGYDPHARACEDCGKQNLDGAVVLADSAGAERRVGSDCAARLTGGRAEVVLHQAKKLSLKTPSYLRSPEQSDYHAPYAEVLERADAMRADPAFREWAAGSTLVNEEGEPLLVYRGVQHPAHIRPVRRKKKKDRSAFWRTPQTRLLSSYTPLATAAAIYSGKSGDIFGQSPPELRRTSTVQPAFVRARKPLSIPHIYTTFGDVLRELHYGEPDGITDEEVKLVLNYLHNRVVGATGEYAGGGVDYKILDEDGEEVEADLGDLLHSRTQVLNLRDEIGWANSTEEVLELADTLHAPTYVFADSPTAKRVAERLGYDAFVYSDLFSPGESAEMLFGKSGEDLEGIEQDWGLEDQEILGIQTVRPFSEEQVRPVIPGGVSTATFLHGLPETPTDRKPPPPGKRKRRRR